MHAAGTLYKITKASRTTVETSKF